MIQQFEDKIPDIYQILSFCLGYLKRKIITLIRLSINEKNIPSKQELMLQFIREQQISNQYAKLIKINLKNLIKKEEQLLFQRFIYRIKEVVRSYLPHACISHELFVYIKKIQTYSFKQNYQLQDYLIFILQQNPQNIKKAVQNELFELKNQKFKNLEWKQLSKQTQRYNDQFQQLSLRTLSPSREYRKSFFSKNSLNLSNKNQQCQSIENNTNNSRDLNNRPIDVFNNSIKPILDCLDCDISSLRAIYFNLQRQKQNCSLSKNEEEIFSNSNRYIKQVEQEMLNQNRLIKQTVKLFDKQFAKYQSRIQKDPHQHRSRNRCQTADPIRRQYNYSILSKNRLNSALNKRQKMQATKKFETINNFTTQQERQQLLKQMQSRKNNVLKMKSISISANKGHFQLCSQTTASSITKTSLMFANLKKAIYRNNSRNTGLNLKRKYEIYLHGNNSSTRDGNGSEDENWNIKRQYKNQHKNQRKDTVKEINRSKKEFIGEKNIKSEAIMGIGKTSSMNNNQNQIQTNNLDENLMKKQNIEIALNYKTVQYKTGQKLDQPFPKTSNNTLNLSNYGECKNLKVNEKQQVDRKYQTIQNNFQVNLLKNIMKGTNVNHRNFANIHYRQKKKFQTLNPQLTVKMIKKS